METPRDIFLMQQNYATLFSLANKVQAEGDKFIGKLTSRQFMAMMALAHLPEDEATINHIARKLGTSKQSVKQLISILEGKGYLTSVPSRKDGRAVNIHFTGAGRDIFLESGEKGMAFLATLFNGFAVDELETLWKLLKKLYGFNGENMDGFEDEANILLTNERGV